MLKISKAKRGMIYLILLCPIFILNASAQISSRKSEVELNNGNYMQAIEIEKSEIKKLRFNKDDKSLLKAFDVIARSQILLQKYQEAESTLGEALQIIDHFEVTNNQKSRIYLTLASLRRSQRDYPKAFDFAKKALAVAPDNPQVTGEFCLIVGRIMFSSGYDYSAIIWLEKAEKIFAAEKITSAKLDTYRTLASAWSSRLDYQKALEYNEKWSAMAENTEYKYKYRQSLFEAGTVLSITGQQSKAFARFEKGLKLSAEQNNSFQSGLFLTSLMLNSLDENNVNEAAGYLRKLEQSNADDQFTFEIILGKAVVAAYQGNAARSEQFFAQLDRMEKPSEYILPSWRLAIAERNKDWQNVIKINEVILALTLKENFRDGLPKIYLDFARAYYAIGQSQKSIQNLEKSISLVEEIRRSENSRFSLGILETFHKAYRLLVALKTKNSQESFELADFLKARLLKDKIGDAGFTPVKRISKETVQKLEALSQKFVADQSVAGEIEQTEKSIDAEISRVQLEKPVLTDLDNFKDLNDSAIVSYFFTLDQKLSAFVWEKGSPVRFVELNVLESEVEKAAATTQKNIKNRIFFKRDGKELYNKLLKPLNVTASHLILIPDKSLWKIPFQALSSDGEKYLIEEKIISYAPSVSILIDQLKKPKSNRRTLQSYANSVFEDKVLQFADTEAASVAEIYGSKPILNATVADFIQASDNSDILHFSMHAQVDKEDPLDSFLGFKKIGKDDGRLTTEELLNINLKKGSMAFLASCDTNNVLNGEGLVSLAWAMMGAGASTVISAQWEANDKSTSIFTRNFYRNYRQGLSAAEALQKASLELIKDKSNNMHEPYYWADFTLNGDFR